MSSLAVLSELLWREREVLDVLLFKLEQERLLVDAGRLEWLPRAAHEIDLVVEELRLIELSRAIETRCVAEELGLPPEGSLAEIAEAAPSPWREMYLAHREAMLRLTERIDATAEGTRGALEAARTTAESRTRDAAVAAGEWPDVTEVASNR
ncbi:MAG: flagellar protein FlgN [Acidothermus sp.]|nr:flagellar protein FlgN [Acidothermus sp.]